MRDARVMGNNIKLMLKKKEISKETFAEKLGYSLFDVQRLCDARLFASQEDIDDISSYFQITPDELFYEHPPEMYMGNGFLHCMNNFKNNQNKDFILDMFDMYCDLKEILSENK